MHFAVKKNEFLRCLKACAQVADAKSTLPILGHVLMREENGLLTLTSSDLTSTVHMACEAKDIGDVGQGLCTSVKQLVSVVSACPGDEVTLASGPNQWTKIRSQKSTWEQAGLAGSQYPAVPKVSKETLAKVSAQAFASLVELTAYCAYLGEDRPHLQGVLIEAQGEMARLVALSSHRMAKASGSLAVGQWRCLVPAPGLRQLVATVGSEEWVEIGVVGDYFVAGVPSGWLAVKRMHEDAFPNIDQIVPTEFNLEIKVQRQALLAAVQRCLVAAFNDAPMTMDVVPVDEKIYLKVQSSQGVSDDQVDVKATGPATRWSISPRYLAEMLTRQTSEDITLKVIDAKQALVFESGQCLSIIAPQVI